MGYRIAANCDHLERWPGADTCRCPALQRTGWRRWLFGRSPRCVFWGLYSPPGVTCAHQLPRVRPPPPGAQAVPERFCRADLDTLDEAAAARAADQGRK